jgi:glycerol dehydrogenase-like iron-containing ADH family enzyme
MGNGTKGVQQCDAIGSTLKSSTLPQTLAELTMTEERKHAILFAATLLCARKLIETIESDKPNLAKQDFVDRVNRMLM